MKLRITITDDNGTVLEVAAAEAEHGSRQIYDYLLKAVYSRDGFMLTGLNESFLRRTEGPEKT